MIHLLDHSRLNWGFDSRNPYVLTDAGDYHNREEVDPFPCYSHDHELVRAEIAHAEEAVPLPFKVNWYILPFEGTSRTNGWAYSNPQWADGEKDKKTRLSPTIVLYGKRIPIHPAMTRYLVSHEYGHIVHFTAAAIRGVKSEDFAAEYAKLRGLEVNASYGALKWHVNTGEIIANDIRILLLNREVDFWPHPFCHPMATPGLQSCLSSFWQGISKELHNSSLTLP